MLNVEPSLNASNQLNLNPTSPQVPGQQIAHHYLLRSILQYRFSPSSNITFCLLSTDRTPTSSSQQQQWTYNRYRCIPFSAGSICIDREPKLSERLCLRRLSRFGFLDWPLRLQKNTCSTYLPIGYLLRHRLLLQDGS